MEELGVGAGLAALAFWGFIAVVVVAGVWNTISKRAVQHETVRRVIESGQTIDQDVLDKLLQVSNTESTRHDQDFKVTGLWMLPISVGLALFALILGNMVPEAKPPILGAAALTGCIGIGALIAGKIAERWYTQNDSALNQLKD